MRRLKKILKALVVVFSMSIALLYIFDYDYILKGVRVVYFTGHTTAYIDDTPYFDTHTIKKGIVQPWDLHEKYNKVIATEKLDSTHKSLGTVAYMIVKNDKIFHEYYAEGYSKTSETNSFSMAKSIITALLFKAIDENYIESLDSKVASFLPEIEGKYMSDLTVGDLSSMASGLDWEESYSSPFSVTAKANYDNDVRSLMLGLKVVEKPGQSFRYLSGATQLLGMVLERATKNTLSDYLSRSFWKPMGMSQEALWQLDSAESNMEKTFCCIASNVRDFARFGQLWMKNGKWNGIQLISEDLVVKAQQPRFEASSQYGYGLWLSNYKGKKVSYMRGILGQYVICIPEDDVLIVRLGHHRSPPTATSGGDDFYTYIDEAYKMLNQSE